MQQAHNGSGEDDVLRAGHAEPRGPRAAPAAGALHLPHQVCFILQAFNIQTMSPHFHFNVWSGWPGLASGAIDLRQWPCRELVAQNVMVLEKMGKRTTITCTSTMDARQFSRYW